MKTVKAQSSYPSFFLYFTIFVTLLLQGGYFTTGLLLLNLMLTAYLLFSKQRIQTDIPLLMMLALFIVMLIWTMMKALDIDAAIHELMKYALFPLSYAVFTFIRNEARVGAVFYRAWIVLMVLGLLAVLGFSVLPGMVTVQGNRLQSLLQYANTTALFMGIGALYSFHLVFSNKKYVYLLLGMLFCGALLLTQSRTTLVVFLIIVGIYSFRSFRARGKMIFAGAALSFIAALSFYGGRIANISIFEPTLVERFITFQDALRILFKETFGMGLGVGNWQYMQFVYQSAPYQVRYIHNAYLQAGMDGGLLALLLFGGIILYGLVKAHKSTSIYAYIVLFMAVHSLFEVNFQYGIVILFFTFALVCLKEPGAGEARWKRLQWTFPKYGKALLALPIVCLLLLFGSEALISSGDAKIHTSKQAAAQDYQAAYRLNPFNNELLFKQAKLERNVDRALAYLEQSYDKNPYDYVVLKSLTEGYAYKGDFNKAYGYAERLVHVFPYHKAHQQLASDVLKQAYEKKAISEALFNELSSQLREKVEAKNKAIHPLYRYIDSDFDY